MRSEGSDRSRRHPQLFPAGRIERSILVIRGRKVILDADLAAFYRVPTKALNQAVKRNRGRFPDDFAFRLTRREKEKVVTICDHLSPLRFSHANPIAFTEHGAVMAANLLNSRRAVDASVLVVRAFVRLRDFLNLRRRLAGKFAELERRLDGHDEAIGGLMSAIRELMDPSGEDPPTRRIGFHRE